MKPVTTLGTGLTQERHLGRNTDTRVETSLRTAVRSGSDTVVEIELDDHNREGCFGDDSLPFPPTLYHHPPLPLTFVPSSRSLSHPPFPPLLRGVP